MGKKQLIAFIIISVLGFLASVFICIVSAEWSDFALAFLFLLATIFFVYQYKMVTTPKPVVKTRRPSRAAAKSAASSVKKSAAKKTAAKKSTAKKSASK